MFCVRQLTHFFQFMVAMRHHLFMLFLFEIIIFDYHFYFVLFLDKKKIFFFNIIFRFNSHDVYFSLFFNFAGKLYKRTICFSKIHRRIVFLVVFRAINWLFFWCLKESARMFSLTLTKESETLFMIFFVWNTTEYCNKKETVLIGL